MPRKQSSDIVLTALAPVAWGTTYYVTSQFLPQNRPLFVSVARALPIGSGLLVFFDNFRVECGGGGRSSSER